MTRNPAALAELLGPVLGLEDQGGDRFIGSHPAASIGRVYGGQMAAQGLRAAAHTTTSDRAVHSLHVSFLGLGDPELPIVYTVVRLRDSSNFSTRLVSAAQDDRLIANMTASFHVARDGFEHAAKPASAKCLPHPEALPPRNEQIFAALGSDTPLVARVPWPIDMRYIDTEPWREAGGDGSTRQSRAQPNDRTWLRADGALADDPIEHACVFAYASDLTMFEPVIAGHGGPPHHLTWERVSRGAIRGATLDHTIWFHRPFRVDEWLLNERASPIAYGSRGLATGRYFTADGVLVASTAQEVALLVDRPKPSGAAE